MYSTELAICRDTSSEPTRTSFLLFEAFFNKSTLSTSRFHNHPHSHSTSSTFPPTHLSNSALLKQNLQPRPRKYNGSVRHRQLRIRIRKPEIIPREQVHEELLHHRARVPPARAIDQASVSQSLNIIIITQATTSQQRTRPTQRQRRPYSPGLLRRTPQEEVRLQVRKLPNRNLVFSSTVLVLAVGTAVGRVHEAKGQELVRAVVVPLVAHHRLLRHADDVASRYDAAVGKGEVPEDLTLDRDWGALAVWRFGFSPPG